MAKKVVFLGMGGTIAGKAESAQDNVGYQAAQVSVQDLLLSVPALQAALGDCVAEAEQVCQIDSKDLVHADWVQLHGRVVHHLSQPEVAGVVVTHGTDTLEESAFFLSQTVPHGLLAHKPVVMTCAMRPATSLAPDGPANMADATSVALHAGACGVMVVCAGKVHSAAHVQKVHPYRVDAFDSGEAGPLGVVEEGRLRLFHGWPEMAPANPIQLAGKLPPGAWPRVEIVYSHAGCTGAVVEALLAASSAQDRLAGLVVAGTGNASLHRLLEQALRAAQAQGVRVARVSRCANGQVVGGGAGARSGDFDSLSWPAGKARVALMLELATPALTRQ